MAETIGKDMSAGSTNISIINIIPIVKYKDREFVLYHNYDMYPIYSSDPILSDENKITNSINQLINVVNSNTYNISLTENYNKKDFTDIKGELELINYEYIIFENAYYCKAIFDIKFENYNEDIIEEFWFCDENFVKTRYNLSQNFRNNHLYFYSKYKNDRFSLMIILLIESKQNLPNALEHAKQHRIEQKYELNKVRKENKRLKSLLKNLS